jgi:hypothetical protein
VADTLMNALDNAAGHHFARDHVPASVREPVMEVLKHRANWWPQLKAELDAAREFLL